jgi:hypothetical protein
MHLYSPKFLDFAKIVYFKKKSSIYLSFLIKKNEIHESARYAGT